MSSIFQITVNFGNNLYGTLKHISQQANTQSALHVSQAVKGPTNTTLD